MPTHADSLDLAHNRCHDPAHAHQPPHGHLSMPDPPGTTRLAVIRDRLAAILRDDRAAQDRLDELGL